MRFIILNRLAHACTLIGCTALIGVVGSASAATMQYSCAYTYEDFIQSKLAAAKPVGPASATLAAPTHPAAASNMVSFAAANTTAPVRRMTSGGLPFLILPPGMMPAPKPVPVPPHTAPPPTSQPVSGGVLTVPLSKTLPMAINTTSPQGLFYTPQELAIWKTRSIAGPFKNANDFAQGTPGDWHRIHEHAEAMVSGALRESVTNAINPDYATNGTVGAGALAMDTAFAYLITNDPRYGDAAKTWLLRTVTNPGNDISKRCFTTIASDGVNPPSRSDTDGFLESQWINRTIMTYDFVKQGMTDSERRLVEIAFLKWGYFFAAHLQWGIETVFPHRSASDYTPGKLINDWAATGPQAKRLADTNHDCHLDAADNQTPIIVHTAVDAVGRPGPEISILSLFYNNRKSSEALSTGLIGLLLQEPRLTAEAKRYVTEWLSYSVWSDGSQGEYQRNGDYCIPQQGLIYGAINTSASLALADGMARKGDTSLYELKVSSGLFGTQSSNGTSKSLLTPTLHHLDLLTGRSKAYFYERDLAVQNPRPATSLGNQTSHFWNPRAMDNYHDVSYLISSRYYQQPYIQDAIMRQPQAGPAVPPFPGSTGNVVSGWSGASTLFPGTLFMYGEIPATVWPYPFARTSQVVK